MLWEFKMNMSTETIKYKINSVTSVSSKAIFPPVRLKTFFKIKQLSANFRTYSSFTAMLDCLHCNSVTKSQTSTHRILIKAVKKNVKTNRRNQKCIQIWKRLAALLSQKCSVQLKANSGTCGKIGLWPSSLGLTERQCPSRTAIIT